ncbi:MAG: hypothetical protein DRO43_06165 [Candidatus Hecatellales archaeon]|nr:MAG: hypothetical protein DRO43_06165 [Candidatus Hecatellales archaeon]
MGIAIFGGTNPLTALSEAGIPVEVKAIGSLLNINEMIDINKL